MNAVINYDMPDDRDSYLQRVGRTGHFRAKDLTINSVSTDEDAEVLRRCRHGSKSTHRRCPARSTQHRTSTRDLSCQRTRSLLKCFRIRENGVAVWLFEALHLIVMKSRFRDMSMARDGGSKRSLIRNLIMLHSACGGEEKGGHSTKMRCPTRSHPGVRVRWAWHKGAVSHSGHSVLVMAPLTEGATGGPCHPLPLSLPHHPPHPHPPPTHHHHPLLAVVPAWRRWRGRHQGQDPPPAGAAKEGGGEGEEAEAGGKHAARNREITRRIRAEEPLSSDDEALWRQSIGLPPRRRKRKKRMKRKVPKTSSSLAARTWKPGRSPSSPSPSCPCSVSVPCSCVSPGGLLGRISLLGSTVDTYFCQSTEAMGFHAFSA